MINLVTKKFHESRISELCSIIEKQDRELRILQKRQAEVRTYPSLDPLPEGDAAWIEREADRLMGCRLMQKTGMRNEIVASLTLAVLNGRGRRDNVAKLRVAK